MLFQHIFYFGKFQKNIKPMNMRFGPLKYWGFSLTNLHDFDD